MNTVKWYVYRVLSDLYPGMVHLTYGSVTKSERNRRNIQKGHANDAYCIGKFRPRHRSRTARYKKVRRHNRVLTRFYDSKWIDRRDGNVKKGAQLPNGRVNRNHKMDTGNLRIYRERRISRGYHALRTKRYALQPGDTVIYKKERYTAIGAKNLGAAVAIENQKGRRSPSVNSVKVICYGNGWAVDYPALKQVEHLPV